MGIVARQGILSAFFLFIGFTLGAVNQVIVLLIFKDEPGEYYGLLQWIVSWAVVFSQFLNFGSTFIIVRFSAELRDKGREKEINYYTWIFPLIGITILGLFLLFFGDWFMGTVEKKVVMESSFLLLILYMHSVFMTYFRSLSGIAVSRFRNVVLAFFSEIFIRLVLLAGIGFYYFGWLDFYGLFIYFAIGQGVQFTGMLIALGGKKLFAIQKPKSESLKESLNYGIYSILDSGASVLVNRLDVIMIGSLALMKDIISYQFAFYMATVIVLPSRSLAYVSSSVVFDYFHNGKMEQINSLYQKNSLIQLLTGGIIFILIWICIDDILSVFPPVYGVARYVFLFLGIAKLFDLITSINGIIIQATRDFRYNFYFNAFLLVIAFIINLMLIPEYGIEGAALATAISVFIHNLMKSIFLYMKHGMQPVHPNTWKALICLGVPYAVALLLPVAFDHPLLAIIYKCGVVSIAFIGLVMLTNVSEDLTNIGNKVIGKFKK